MIRLLSKIKGWIIGVLVFIASVIGLKMYRSKKPSDPSHDNPSDDTLHDVADSMEKIEYEEPEKEISRESRIDRARRGEY